MDIFTARSFDCGNSMLNDADTTAIGQTTASVTHAHTGTYSLRIVGLPACSARWAIASEATGLSDDEPSVSVWIHPHSVQAYDNSDRMRLRYLLGTGEYIDLRWNATTHTFDAYINDALAFAGTVEVSTIDWFHVQFFVIVADVVDGGHISVKIDGHVSIDEDCDTQPGVQTTATYFYAYCAGASAEIYLDDLVIGREGYLGDLRCVDIMPDGDDAVTIEWTPSVAGDNYLMVDEVPPVDTDYVYTDTDDQEDFLNLSAYDGVTYSPVGVTAWVRSKMETATGDSIIVGIWDTVAGSGESDSRALSTDWEYYFYMADARPGGAGEWTDAAVDGLQINYRSAIV